ncbi:MAG: hypothetical protein GY862_01505 [Gammaproteobacteria bacterium]|nr:hypothetical protein [Gammaproteobacteria bacterium]
MHLYRPTLSQTISVILAGMILLSATVVAVNSYFSSRATLLRFSRAQISQNTLLAKEKIETFLFHTRSAAELALALSQSDMVDSASFSDLETLFFKQLSLARNVSVIDYGDPQGNFIMVKRQPDGSLASKLIQHIDGQRRVQWRYRKPGAAINEILRQAETPDDPYDPRQRPWYIEAKRNGGLYWTDVYVFWSDHEPGITAAVPDFTQDGQLRGVLSADVSLNELALFLKKNHVGASGHAFLLDQQKRLIVTDEGAELVSPARGKMPRLKQLAESGLPELAALNLQARVQEFLEHPRGSETVNYQVGEQTFVATLTAIQIAPGKTWIIGMVALEDEFLVDVRHANFQHLLITLGLVLLALAIGLVFAHFIARALRRLAVESKALTNFQFDDFSAAASRSSFREVDEVLRAFATMKLGLRAFRKYVPIKLVQTLLTQEQEPRLGGKSRMLTILFSDIRDFTRISETMPPVQLAKELGWYLSALTGRIQAHSGTVDKYIGDSVMAFWGAPEPVPQHALQACLSALAIQREIGALRGEHPEMQDFYTRIGIHTGEVLVGNFGAMNRFNYTVIGDGVNLASRLEGLNKIFGTRIIISDATRMLVEDICETRRLGVVAVKGRRQLCVVYELLGRHSEIDPFLRQQARLYETALDLYLARNWEKAIPHLQILLRNERTDKAANWLLGECLRCRDQEPPPEWQGEITMREK